MLGTALYLPLLPASRFPVSAQVGVLQWSQPGQLGALPIQTTHTASSPPLRQHSGLVYPMLSIYWGKSKSMAFCCFICCTEDLDTCPSCGSTWEKDRQHYPQAAKELQGICGLQVHADRVLQSRGLNGQRQTRGRGEACVLGLG